VMFVERLLDLRGPQTMATCQGYFP
jgi:hypothetical protein